MGNTFWIQGVTKHDETNMRVIVMGNGVQNTGNLLVALNSADNVGIGTAAPGTKIEMNTTGRDCVAVLRRLDTTVQTIFGSEASAGVIGTTNSFSLRFVIAFIQRMILDTNGYLGIGVTPSAPLHITQPTSSLAFVDSTSTGGTTGSGFVTLNVGGVTRYIRLESSS